MTPNRVINFGAGPSALPFPVLSTIHSELLDFAGSGMSVLELSHRGTHFMSILDDVEKRLRDFLAIPSTYKVMFLQGGGTLQFAMIPMNLIPMDDKTAVADYVVTGTWSEKAAAEAKKLGYTVNFPFNSSTDSLTNVDQWSWSSNPSIIYFCDNETIHGLEFPPPSCNPIVQKWKNHIQLNGKKAVLVADMSSNFLSRPFDVSNFGLVFATAQKNIGTSGVTVVIVRSDLLNPKPTPRIPTMLDYQIQAVNRSIYNTPPTFSIYCTDLVIKHLQKEFSTLEAIDEFSKKKAGLIYEIIDGSNGFYKCLNSSHRSRMNIVFRITDAMKDGVVSESLENEFLELAEKKGMVGLAGHRSVGGIRASLYNAITLDQAERLCSFMKQFYCLKTLTAPQSNK